MANNRKIRNNDINITSDTSLNADKDNMRPSGPGLVTFSENITIEISVLVGDILESFSLETSGGVEFYTVEYQDVDRNWQPLNENDTVSN